MLLLIFFLIGSIISIISQYSIYQRLGNDALKSKEPEEIAALRSAQNKKIPNLLILVIGLIIGLIALSFYFLSPPSL